MAKYVDIWMNEWMGDQMHKWMNDDYQISWFDAVWIPLLFAWNVYFKTFFSLCKYFKKLYWSTIDSQYYIGFRCTA